MITLCTSNRIIGALIFIVFISIMTQVQPKSLPSGFASVSGKGLETTIGGYGGETVTVKNQSELEKHAGSSDKKIILIEGSITIKPFGKEINVKSNKTIRGVGTKSEIVSGGFRLINVSNVIVQNLTIRDFYLEGDWAGKKNDYDGFQMDNSHHIWIDHCHLSRGGDGLIDSRKGTTFLTVSWCIFSNHNKTFGIGWTNKVETQVTIHHCWFRKTNQRNPSGDNILRAHLYNNLLEDVEEYGNWARGGANMIIENSVYRNVCNPHFVKHPVWGADPTGSLKVTGCIYEENVTGQKIMEFGKPYFDPGDFYDYTLHPADQVRSILTSCAGPQENFDCENSYTEINNIKSVLNSSPVISIKDNCNVLMDFPNSKPKKISIYSSTGMLLYNKSGIHGSSIRWKASGSGIYYIHCINNSGKVNTLKTLIID